MNPFKHTFFGLLALACPMVLTSCDDDEDFLTSHEDWVLVWADEFDTPTADNRPDPAKWTYELGAGGYGNEEKQNYTDRVENACYAVEDGVGCLKITALNDNYQNEPYSSARIRTEGRFAATYGKFEARMKLPYGPGIWPAFWLLGTNFADAGWPGCGEIDIMENKGRQPGIVSSAMHCPGHFGGNPFTKTFGYPDQRFDTGFHTYAAEWSKDRIIFRVDGFPYHIVNSYEMEKEAWVFDHPFYVILNLAIGGTFGGDPTADTVFPQSLYVDYVRVYQPREQVTSEGTTVGGGINDWGTAGDTNADIR